MTDRLEQTAQNNAVIPPPAIPEYLNEPEYRAALQSVLSFVMEIMAEEERQAAEAARQASMTSLRAA